MVHTIYHVVLSTYRTRLHPISTYHGIPTLPPYPTGGGYPRLEGGYTSTYDYDEISPYPSKCPRPPRVTVGDGGMGRGMEY